MPAGAGRASAVFVILIDLLMVTNTFARLACLFTWRAL
jgi:hypothetical protein